MQNDSTTRIRRGTIAGGLALIVIATAACGSNHGNKANGATSGVSQPAASSSPSGGGAGTHAAGSGKSGSGAAKSSPAVAIPTSVPNSPADRKAVTLTTCSPTEDGVKAGGTITRQGGSAADYTITVFFTTSHATVLNYVSTNVHAEPGKPATWSVGKEFSAPKDVRCVLRGVAAK